VVTNPRLPGKRFTTEEAVQLVDQWLDQPNLRLLAPDDQHWIILRQMLMDGQARGPLVSDAQLAALTTEYGGIPQTTDRDFVPGLRWSNPPEQRTGLTALWNARPIPRHDLKVNEWWSLSRAAAALRK
jgi:hypothetical protein